MIWDNPECGQNLALVTGKMRRFWRACRGQRLSECTVRLAVGFRGRPVQPPSICGKAFLTWSPYLGPRLHPALCTVSTPVLPAPATAKHWREGCVRATFRAGWPFTQCPGCQRRGPGQGGERREGGGRHHGVPRPRVFKAASLLPRSGRAKALL